MAHPNGVTRNVAAWRSAGRLRRSGWVGATVVLVLASGCTQQVAGAPTQAPTTSAPAAPATDPATDPAAETTLPPSGSVPSADYEGGCVVSLSGGGIRMSGGGRVRTVNGVQQFACRRGPLVTIEAVGADGVRFNADGASVLVAANAVGQVGAYRITMRRLAPPAAEFEALPTA